MKKTLSTDRISLKARGGAQDAQNEPISTVVNGFPASDHDGINRSLRFMAKNYTRPIQLHDVVNVSGMSRRGLIKAFNRHMGIAPGEFMRQARIEYAKCLLVKQDLPLKIIAETAGFRSENTFCVAFNRATGLSPKRYQRQVWLTTCRSMGL